jgi:uncharacterized membrane protein SpoIIM required for sporulation
MLEFIQNHEELIIWLSLASIIGLIVSIVVIPWVIIKLPPDYFVYTKRETKKIFCHHPFCRALFLIFKNILGIALIISGIIMLFIPGQGLLTIIIGVILTDFPYKYKIERWIISRPHILSTVNRLRKKAKQPPFTLH